MLANKCSYKIKPFTNKYSWEGTNFSSEKDDWKKFEKNNVTIALNVLYAKKEKTYPAYVSKKQVLLLMISNAKTRELSLKGAKLGLKHDDYGIILQ